MSTDPFASLVNLPDIWGEGAIFGFSGLDGPTNAASQFVATLGQERYTLLFHTATRRLLQIRLPTIDNPLLVTGDVLLAETQTQELFLTWSAWHTLVGLAPAQTKVRLVLEDGTPGEVRGNVVVLADPQGRDALALIHGQGQLAVSYGRTAQEAIERATAGLGADLNAIVQERMRTYTGMPMLADAGRDRLLKKCFSVMKANTLAAEGAMGQFWSTPHRISCRDMLLRESVFHSLAMNHLHPRVAWEFLEAVLETQNDEGMIPHRVCVAGSKSSLTHPPLLAWGVWVNYQHMQEKSTLQYALPRLQRYLAWDLAHRDHNGNGLLEWQIEGGPQHRSPESGMDNSPRFDRGAAMDAVDFSALMACDMIYMARIAQVLGDQSAAEYWRNKAGQISQQIHARLWNPARAFYFDRHLDGQFSSVMAVSGLMPLLLDDLPLERVGSLAAKLGDPTLFNTAFPVPSVAASDPTWSTDRWRGPTWAMTNHLIILGLRRHGQKEVSDWLKEKTIHHVQKHYERSGVLSQCYDAQDTMAPTQLGNGADATRDFHATAAVVAALLMEDVDA